MARLLAGARRGKDLSQAELAEGMGVSRTQVGSYEDATDNLKAPTVRKAAELLGVTEYWLMFGEGPMWTDASAPAPTKAKMGLIEGMLNELAEIDEKVTSAIGGNPSEGPTLRKLIRSVRDKLAGLRGPAADREPQGFGPENGDAINHGA